MINPDGLRAEVYHLWGCLVSWGGQESKEPKRMYQRLLEEIASSLTQQRERLLDLIDEIIGAVVEESCPSNVPPEDWDWKSIETGVSDHIGIVPCGLEEVHEIQELASVLYQQAEEAFLAQEEKIGPELLLRLFRHFYLEEIDRAWVEHLTNMEHLRDGIGLRGYGNRDPKQEYKKEGYEIFIQMMATVSSNVCAKVFKLKAQKENEIEQMEREGAARYFAQEHLMQMRHGNEVFDSEGVESLVAGGVSGVSAQVRRDGPKIGRNDPCPCGSGQKFKKCHGLLAEGGPDSVDEESS
ncbi:SEC-C metal-binding domain-containing protein [Pajaroellobacter abortibovis]